MDGIPEGLQLVILESPFDTWDDPRTSTLFSGMVALKRAGYGSNYVNDVLPVDTTDFIATHVLLCENRSGALKPVMGYKSTTLDDAKKNKLAFPGLNLVKCANSPEHVQAVESIIERCERDGRNLAYLGSWTVDPEFKNKSGLRSELREAFYAFYRAVYREQGVDEVIIGGTLRFGTEKIFAELGHKPLSLGGQPLPPIQVLHLAGEPVLVMHSREFSASSVFLEKKWLPLWNDRIHVRAEQKKKADKKSA